MSKTTRFIFFLSSIGISFWSGFVFSKLWAWFLVPIFNLPPIGLVHSMGLILVAGLLNMRYVDYGEKSEDEMMVVSLIFYFTYSSMILLSGWIYKFFI